MLKNKCDLYQLILQNIFMNNFPKNLNKEFKPKVNKKNGIIIQRANLSDQIIASNLNPQKKNDDINSIPKTKKITKKEIKIRQFQPKQAIKQINNEKYEYEEDIEIEIIKKERKKKQSILFVDGKGLDIFLRQQCHLCGATISKTTNHQCETNNKTGYKFKQAISGQKIIWCCRKGYCLNGNSECKCQNKKNYNPNLLSLRNKKIADLEFSNQINLQPFQNFPLMVYMMKKLMSQTQSAFEENQIQAFKQTFSTCMQRSMNENNTKTIFYSMDQFKRNIQFPETRYQLYQYIGACVFHSLKKKRISIIQIENIAADGFLDLIGAFSPIQLMQAMGIVKRKIWAIQKRRIQSIMAAKISNQLYEFCSILQSQILQDRDIVYVPSSLIQHYNINTSILSGYFFQTVPYVEVNCELMDNIWNSLYPKNWSKYITPINWNAYIANPQEKKQLDKGEQVEIYFPQLKFEVDYTCIGIYEAGLCTDFKTQQRSFIRRFMNLRARMETCSKQIWEKCKKSKNTRAMQIYSIQMIEEMKPAQKKDIQYIQQTNEAIHLMQLDYIIKIKKYFEQLHAIGRQLSTAFITIAQLEKYNRYTLNGLFSAKAIVNNWPTIFKPETYVTHEESSYFYINEHDIDHFKLWCFRYMIDSLRSMYKLTCINMKSIIFHAKKQQKKKLFLFTLSYLTKQSIMNKKDKKINELLQCVDFKVSDLINDPQKFEALLSTYYQEMKIINGVKCFMNKKKAHEFNIKGQQYYIGPIKQNQMKDNTVFIDSYHQILSKKIHTSRYTLPTNDEIVLDEWAMKNQLRFRSLISVNEIKLMGILKIYEKMTWGAIKQKYQNAEFARDECLIDIIKRNSKAMNKQEWIIDEVKLNSMTRNEFEISLISSQKKIRTIQRTPTNRLNSQQLKYDRKKHIYFNQTQPNNETYQFRIYNIRRTNNELAIAFKYWENKIRYTHEIQDKLKKYMSIWRKEIGQTAGQLNSMEVVPSKRFIMEKKKINDDYMNKSLDLIEKRDKQYLNFRRQKQARIQTWMLMEGYKLASDFALQAIKYEEHNYQALFQTMKNLLQNEIKSVILTIDEITETKQRVMNQIDAKGDLKRKQYKQRAVILKLHKYEEKCEKACEQLLQKKKKRIIQEAMKDVIFQKTLELNVQFNLSSITDKRITNIQNSLIERNITTLNFKQNKNCSRCKTSFKLSQRGKYVCCGFQCQNSIAKMNKAIKLNCRPNFFLQNKKQVAHDYQFKKIPLSQEKNNLREFIYNKYERTSNLSHQYIWDSDAPQQIKVNIQICRMQKPDVQITQYFQENFDYVALRMVMTKHGIGIQATSTIQNNTFIGFYIGEIIQMNKLEAQDQDSLVNIGWLEDKYYVIRPHEYMNHARFFNGASQKSKANNLRHTWIYTQINKKETIALMLYTKRQIIKGEQLRWNYGSQYKY